MMSTIFDQICSQKKLCFLLIVFTVFTVSLTENLQLADGLNAIAHRVNFELEVGESDMQTWNVINNSDEKTWIEFYADGPGSEFLTFKKFFRGGLGLKRVGRWWWWTGKNKNNIPQTILYERGYVIRGEPN